MCHVSLFTLFFTKRLSLLVEGLILTGLVFNLKHIYAWTWQSWILSVLNLISYCFTLHFFCFFLLMDAHHFLHPVFYYYDEFHVMLRLSILAVTLSGTNKMILSHVCNSILWFCLNENAASNIFNCNILSERYVQFNWWTLVLKK